jgi:hypothetical protein
MKASARSSQSQRVWAILFVLACVFVLSVVALYIVWPVPLLGAVKAMALVSLMVALLVGLDWRR